MLMVLAALVTSTAAPAKVTKAGPAREIEMNWWVPAELRPTGAHGKAVVMATVASGSRLADVALATSTRSDALDRIVLERLRTAPVGSDLKVGTPLRITVAIDNTRGLNLGAIYFCRQAVLDHDWYLKTYKTTDFERTPLFGLIVGGALIGGDPALKFTLDTPRYERAWRQSLEVCRQRPERTFLATLMEQGSK